MRRLPLRGAPALVAALGLSSLAAACDQHGVVRRAPPPPARYEIGRAATPEQIARWDIDVNPSGAGLPAGRGTAAEGATVYARKCAACHGPKGEGVPPGPRLIGRDPRDGFPFASDVKLVKTVGNYWPYATTLYDYVHRAMPLGTPGTLQPDEVYAVVAWLLAENEIIPRDAEMNARSLAAVKMPAHDRFVPDNRRGGREVR